MIDVETLAYAAGFIDGEGCISISKVLPPRYTSPSYWLEIKVSSTDEASIDFLNTVFGGHTRSRAKDQSMKKEGWRTAWEWSITGTSAQQFLMQILPYLKIKHHQATIAIEFQTYSLAHSMRVCKSAMKQAIINRKEVYRQHLNSFHGTKRRWTRSEEFAISDIPHTSDPIAILSYTAGLMDGEGCINISLRMPNGEHGKGKLRAPSHCLRVKLTNTDFPVIEWLQYTFGGSTGNGNGTVALDQGNSPARDWILSSENAKTFLERIIPYLKLKQEQARVGIAFQTYNKEHSRHVISNQTQEVVDRKEEYRQRLNSMNMIRKPVTSIYV